MSSLASISAVAVLADDFDVLSKKKYKEQLTRAIHMEELHDKIMNALSFEDVLDKLIELDEEIKELKAYYEGPAWREDYETDLNDLFPANLKRGILAEDILYDLLAEVEQVLEEKIPTINPGDKDED